MTALVAMTVLVAVLGFAAGWVWRGVFDLLREVRRGPQFRHPPVEPEHTAWWAP